MQKPGSASQVTSQIKGFSESKVMKHFTILEKCLIFALLVILLSESPGDIFTIPRNVL